jgi:hypothetical protein
VNDGKLTDSARAEVCSRDFELVMLLLLAVFANRNFRIPECKGVASVRGRIQCQERRSRIAGIDRVLRSRAASQQSRMCRLRCAQRRARFPHRAVLLHSDV